MRAQVANFDELPYYDRGGQALIGAGVPTLGPDLSRPRRLLEMLVSAIESTLVQVKSVALEDVPLVVCLAEPGRPGGAAHLASHIVGAVERRLDVSFHPEYSGVIAKGHTAGFHSLRVAKRLMEEASLPACLVCGVDSYLNATVLDWLDRHLRLKTEENSDGVIPGEAAASVLVSRVELDSVAPALRVFPPGFAHEPAGVLTDEPLLGTGLAKAHNVALRAAGSQMHEIDFRVSDATGESYGFREQALVVARTMRGRREEFPIWHCADSIGDTGAAAGLCQLVVLSDAFEKSYAPGPRAICSTSSVPGNRAVCVATAAGG